MKSISGGHAEFFFPFGFACLHVLLLICLSCLVTFKSYMKSNNVLQNPDDLRYQIVSCG